MTFNLHFLYPTRIPTSIVSHSAFELVLLTNKIGLSTGHRGLASWQASRCLARNRRHTNTRHLPESRPQGKAIPPAHLQEPPLHRDWIIYS